VVYGFWFPRFFIGLLFIPAGLMYWLAIRWVDQHGQWSEHREEDPRNDAASLARDTKQQTTTANPAIQRRDQLMEP
jgi:hypothetical protein